MNIPQFPSYPWAFLHFGLMSAVLITAFTAFVAVAQAQPTPQGQNLNELVEEANGFEARIVGMEERYLRPALLESRYRLETRFNEAKVAYLLKDYIRASILFVAVIDNPRVRQFDSYRDALYLLADSLLQMRNYRAARDYFRQVVVMGPGLYYQEAVISMLEIAALTRDYDGVEDLYGRLDSLQEISPALSYMRAKTLYNETKYAEARQWFSRSARAPEYAFVGRYFEGVSFAAERRFDDANQVFNAILQQQPSNDKERQIIDLTHLALGRLAYEAEAFDTAVDYYIRIPRTSPSFDRALFELTWALVAQERFVAAQRNIEVLLLFDPDMTLVPEAKLLLADLGLRTKEYDNAFRAYEDVISTFVPVKNELDNFIAEHDDLEAFFVELVRRDIEGTEPEYLPPMVADFAGSNPLLDSVTQVVFDGMITQEDIDEAMDAIEQIEARIESGSRVEAFPLLAEGMAVGIETENQILELHHNLMHIEKRLLAASMNSQEAQRWAQLEQELAQFQRSYAETPKTREEIRKRGGHVSSEFDRLRKDLDSVAYEIESQQIQARAIDTYLRNNANSHDWTPQQQQDVQTMRAEVREILAELEQVRSALQRKLDLARRDVGVGDGVTNREARMRAQYRQLLAERRDFLQTMHARGGPDARGQLQRITAARAKMPRVEARLEGFFGTMAEIVDENVQNVRQQVQTEQRLLLAYQEELNRVRAQSESTAAGLAYLNFLHVSNQFAQIVMRGEVGRINVSWQRKDDTSTAIRQLFENRSAELQMLQESFKDVR